MGKINDKLKADTLRVSISCRVLQHKHIFGRVALMDSCTNEHKKEIAKFSLYPLSTLDTTSSAVLCQRADSFLCKTFTL